MAKKSIDQIYIPMTETAFYILLSLRQPRHGYGIMQHVAELTRDRVSLGPGTLSGSLSKMEKDGLIRFLREESNRKVYHITDIGYGILQKECLRVAEQYSNLMLEGMGAENE